MSTMPCSSRYSAVWKPSGTIRTDSIKLLTDLAPAIDAACARDGEPFVLDTDMHPAYPKAIRSVPMLARRLESGSLQHRRTSSRKKRSTKNPLFSVNYVDRQMRSSIAEYVRETTRQGREVNSQMERMAIFMALHNFASPHRVDGRARIAPTATTTHADIAGIGGPRTEWTLERMLTHRHVYSHTSGRFSWITRTWRHEHDNPPVVRLKKGVVTQRSVALDAAQTPAYLRV